MVIAERQKLSLKINDQVQVIAGREKGKIGKVIQIDSKNLKITLEQINLVKKHNRKSSPSITLKEMPSQMFCYFVKNVNGVFDMEVKEWKMKRQVGDKRFVFVRDAMNL